MRCASDLRRSARIADWTAGAVSSPHGGFLPFIPAWRRFVARRRISRRYRAAPDPLQCPRGAGGRNPGQRRPPGPAQDLRRQRIAVGASSPAVGETTTQRGPRRGRRASWNGDAADGAAAGGVRPQQSPPTATTYARQSRPYCFGSIEASAGNEKTRRIGGFVRRDCRSTSGRPSRPSRTS